MQLAQCLNTIGLICDIFGAWFVAWEVVKQFQSKRYDVSEISFVPENMGPGKQDQRVTETQDYQGWERRKYRRMKLGLGLLTVGFLLQILATWMR